MTKKRIAIWGASTVWGAWDHEMGGRVARLRKYLDATESAFVYNLGVSGATTNDILARFEIEAKARRPHIVIFSIGVNDASYFQGADPIISLQQFSKNLEQLIVMARGYTETILFVGIGHVDESKTMPWRIKEQQYRDNEHLQIYNEEIKHVCEKNNILFLNIFDLLAVQDLPDGLHPDEVGHEKIYVKVRDFLIEKKLIE